jgi:hypothetical protein
VMFPVASNIMVVQRSYSRGLLFDSYFFGEAEFEF